MLSFIVGIDYQQFYNKSTPFFKNQVLDYQQVFINESEQVALYFLLFRIETGWLHCYAVNQKEQN